LVDILSQFYSFLMLFLMRISCEGPRLSHSHHPYKGMRREKVEQDRPVSGKMERGHIAKMELATLQALQGGTESPEGASSGACRDGPFL
jgi:hypothetical protein